MKFRKIGAISLAAALMATSTAIVASADIVDFNETNDNGTVRLVVDKDAENGLFGSWDDKVGEVYGIRYTVQLSEGDWLGGGIGANSQSTGWKSIEWGTSGKDITATLDESTGLYTIEWKLSDPVFVDTDTYCQLWIQCWTGTIVSIEEIEVLGSDGSALWAMAKDGDAYVNIDAKYTSAAAEAETTTEEEDDVVANDADVEAEDDGLDDESEDETGDDDDDASFDDDGEDFDEEADDTDAEAEDETASTEETVTTGSDDAETATTGDVDAAADSSKGSPDTGIADVAAVAGLAVVAAGAVVVAKKRK